MHNLYRNIYGIKISVDQSDPSSIKPCIKHKKSETTGNMYKALNTKRLATNVEPLTPSTIYSLNVTHPRPEPDLEPRQRTMLEEKYEMAGDKKHGLHNCSSPSKL